MILCVGSPGFFKEIKLYRGVFTAHDSKIVLIKTDYDLVVFNGDFLDLGINSGFARGGSGRLLVLLALFVVMLMVMNLVCCTLDGRGFIHKSIKLSYQIVIGYFLGLGVNIGRQEIVGGGLRGGDNFRVLPELRHLLIMRKLELRGVKLRTDYNACVGKAAPFKADFSGMPCNVLGSRNIIVKGRHRFCIHLMCGGNLAFLFVGKSLLVI